MDSPKSRAKGMVTLFFRIRKEKIDSLLATMCVLVFAAFVTLFVVARTLFDTFEILVRLFTS